MIQVERLTDCFQRSYLSFLHGFDDSLFYYSLKYKVFLEDLLGCRSCYWIARDGDRVLGVLPLMEKAGPWGRVLNSLPFYGSNGGILAKSTQVYRVLIDKFNEIASESDIASATLIEHPFHLLDENLIDHDLLDERIGQLTKLDELDKSAKSIVARIESSARRNIRKAKRCGVQVTIDNAAVDFLARTHRENMTKIGGRSKSRMFFEKLNHFTPGQDYNIYVASRLGKRAAALLLFYFNRTVEYYMPVTCSSEKEFQPMAMILHRAMIEAVEQGFVHWNWGGTWKSQSGVRRFKRKWGGRDHPYRYFVKLNEPRILEKGREEIAGTYPDFYVVPFDYLSKTH